MTISGQYTTAEIFTENIEDAALQWVREQCDHPAFEGVRILQMPDVHAGNACNVGTVYRIGAYVNPDHVGVDIGCTISMHRLSAAMNPDNFALLDHRIRETVPTGTEICERLLLKLLNINAESEATSQKENWTKHDSLVRGNPVRKFSGPL